ncbi:hypothetical protein [Sporosarcina psychrophila]|uniref:Uncharacterized protein n=1 Tax=Sporosarcina psychrophila TaxID=1476 RepID=A0ABV2KDH4_SPOPS
MHSIIQRIKKRHGHVTMAVVKRVPVPFTQWCEKSLELAKVFSIDAVNKKRMD